MTLALWTIAGLWLAAWLTMEISKFRARLRAELARPSSLVRRGR
jgi:hypothetical protein